MSKGVKLLPLIKKLILQELLLLLPDLSFVCLYILISHSDVFVSEQITCQFEILMSIVVIGSMSSPEVVALDILAVFLEEASQPQG